MAKKTSKKTVKKPSTSRKTVKERSIGKAPAKAVTTVPTKKVLSNTLIKTKYIVVIIGIILIAVGAYVMFLITPDVELVDTVGFGDNVTFKYVATDPNGTGLDSGTVTVTIGTGNIIPGVENALIGMTVGETKKEAVMPQDAYGEKNPALIVPFKRFMVINRTFKISLEVLEDDVRNDTVEVGKTVRAITMEWPVTVLDIDNENITTLRQEPVNGSYYYPMQNPFAIKVVDVNDQNLTIENIGRIGSNVRIGLRMATVTEVINDSIILDFNHPYAGKVLMYDIEIVGINQES